MLRWIAIAAIACGVAACASPLEPVASASAANSAALDPALVARGEDAYFQCKGCHAIAKGAPSSAGPNLYAVFGRVAGKQSGFPFTDALAGSNITWDRESLDAFLADPSGYVPGSDMRRGVVRDPETRAAIIAYLASQSD